LIHAGDIVSRHDHPHARSPKRHSFAYAIDDRTREIEAIEKPHNGRRFAAGYDQGIDCGEIAARLDGSRPRTDLFERVHVLDDVTLQSEDADGGFGRA
jgi:hypothetical protein